MKRMIAFVLVILLLIPFGLTQKTEAADRNYGSVQILIGDLETDCMAEKILAGINTSGLSDKAKIQKVYDWIITHCTRGEPTYDDYNDSYGVTDQELSAYSYQLSELYAQGKAIVRKDLADIYTDYSMSGYSSDYDPSLYDSNFYVRVFANTMMYTRKGNCAHFSALLAVLLGHLGYDVRLIPGYFINKNGSTVMHKWNCVLVNGTYYWLDVRMDHASYSGSSVPHNYFYISSNTTWAKNHKWVTGYTDLLQSNTTAIMNLYKNPLVHTHSYEVVEESPANCTDAGYKVQACTKCSSYLYDYYPKNNVHSFQVISDVGSQTCTTSRTVRYRCNRCGKEKTETFPALGHAWKLTEVLTEADGPHASSGLYTCSRCNETKEARLCAEEVFIDMPPEGNWAHDPIDWAYFSGITSGKTDNTFGPKEAVTRAEAVTFLWKAMGSPETTAEENPFTDVPEGKYFYKPVMWAYYHEPQITSGATASTFGPKQKCTRAQVVMFLWAAAGKPEPITAENPFTDVKETDYFCKAVLWAVENGITGGTTPTTFGPKQTCTRAQVVTFLYKAVG